MKVKDLKAIETFGKFLVYTECGERLVIHFESDTLENVPDELLEEEVKSIYSYKDGCHVVLVNKEANND